MAGQSSSDDKEHLFTSAEMEFCAEDEIVSIVPNFASSEFELISGKFGPFRPQIPVEVPLWLAIALHTRGKCVIQPPEWLNVENLTKVLEEERESQGAFQPLPFHYMEIAQLLMKNAPNDIPDRFQVCSVLEDLKDVRFHKIESGLQQLTGRRYAVKLNNLGAMELNIIRPFLTKSLEYYFRLDKEDEPAPPPVPPPLLSLATPISRHRKGCCGGTDECMWKDAGPGPTCCIPFSVATSIFQPPSQRAEDLGKKKEIRNLKLQRWTKWQSDRRPLANVTL